MLIGDAAHGTLPFLAQGAAMALEDAAALLTCENAPSFEQARRSRCDRLHQQTLATGRIYHLARPLSQARDLVLQFTPGQLPLDRLEWLYSG